MSEITKKQSKKEEMPSSNSSQSFVTLEDRARAFNLGAMLLEKSGTTTQGSTTNKTGVDT